MLYVFLQLDTICFYPRVLDLLSSRLHWQTAIFGFETALVVKSTTHTPQGNIVASDKTKKTRKSSTPLFHDCTTRACSAALPKRSRNGSTLTSLRADTTARTSATHDLSRKGLVTAHDRYPHCVYAWPHMWRWAILVIPVGKTNKDEISSCLVTV